MVYMFDPFNTPAASNAVRNFMFLGSTSMPPAFKKGKDFMVPIEGATVVVRGNYSMGEYEQPG